MYDYMVDVKGGIWNRQGDKFSRIDSSFQLDSEQQVIKCVEVSKDSNSDVHVDNYGLTINGEIYHFEKDRVISDGNFKKLTYCYGTEFMLGLRKDGRLFQIKPKDNEFTEYQFEVKIDNLFSSRHRVIASIAIEDTVQADEATMSCIIINKPPELNDRCTFTDYGYPGDTIISGNVGVIITTMGVISVDGLDYILHHEDLVDALSLEYNSEVSNDIVIALDSTGNIHLYDRTLDDSLFKMMNERSQWVKLVTHCDGSSYIVNLLGESYELMHYSAIIFDDSPDIYIKGSTIPNDIFNQIPTRVKSARK